MLDNEFKLNVVKILKKLSDRMLNNSNSTLDNDYPNENILWPISVSNPEKQLILYHNGELNSPIDLNELFEPSRNFETLMSDDDTTIHYSIIGENEISAYIQNDNELVVPTVDSQIKTYTLNIELSTEAFGFCPTSLVIIDLIFID